MTTRSAKTGNQTENRNPGQPENFMTDESINHYKYSCIKIFSIQPSEAQKPETGQKTGSRIKKIFSTKVAEFNNKLDGQIKFTIFQSHISNFYNVKKVTTTTE